MGKQNYYGLYEWPGPGHGKYAYAYFEGQEDDAKPLLPGDERETFVTTSTKERVLAAIKDYKGGALFWRVQLRRGLVKYTDENGRSGEVSATAVFGVEFEKDQIDS